MPLKKKRKRLLPNTLFGRSLLIIMTPLLLLQFFATYIFYDRHWSRMTDRLAYALVGEVSVIYQKLEADGFERDSLARVSETIEDELGLLVHYDPARSLPEETLSGWRPLMVAQPLDKKLSEALKQPYSLHVGSEERWFDVAIQTSDGGVLTISVPERRLFSSSSYIFVLWMVGLSVVLFSIAIIFMRNQIRPIRRLAVAADWIGRGKDVPRFKPEGAREVRQAAHAFIAMRDRLRRQISQRAVMLAGVSHDLRTPLTRMRLALEMFDNVCPKDKQALEDDISEMERMIDGYLDFIRGEGTERADRISFLDFINDFKENIQAPYSKAIAFIENDSMRESDMRLWLRRDAMSRCLHNIVNNALVFAKAEVQITLDYIASYEVDDADEHSVIRVLIEDDGPGIPEEKRDEVFKPFYRIEGSRNKKTGGVGLGMSIAMDVVHSHGGTIELMQSQSLGGLCVEIILPL